MRSNQAPRYRQNPSGGSKKDRCVRQEENVHSFLKESLDCWFAFFGAFSFAWGLSPFLVASQLGPLCMEPLTPCQRLLTFQKYKIWMHVDVSIREGAPRKCSCTFCPWSSWNEMYYVIFLTLEFIPRMMIDKLLKVAETMQYMTHSTRHAAKAEKCRLTMP